MTKQNSTEDFLAGGGEMGLLTRNFDWSRTSIGAPAQWPSSLRVTVSNLLRSKFPMFLWWGPDMIQFYNDAYRPSLGKEGKHPDALGKKGKETWPEIWEIIAPMLSQVQTTGEATWSENQLVPIFRNGKIEDVYWTFSYSSVLDDEGKHGGILVTCVETTKTVQDEVQLQESKRRLQFALTAGHLGSWELDLATMELHASAICKQIFGQPLDRPFHYETLRNTIHPADRERQEKAVMHTIRTGADYDIEYRVIVPDGSLRWVNVRGQVGYNQQGDATSMAGISLDITERKKAENKLTESEEKLRSIVNSAPTAMCLFVGPDLVVENPNPLLIEVIGAGPDIEGRSFREVLSGVVENDQQFIGLIENVRVSGVAFEAREVPVYFSTQGKTRHFNISFIPLFDNNHMVYAVLDVSVDVTDQVEAQQKLEESKLALATALEQVRLSKEAAELGTFDMDLVQGTMHWDARCRILFGITHHDMVTYEKDFVQGLHPDDRARILQIIDGSFKKAESNGNYDVEYRTIGAEDHVERWVRAKGKVYFDALDNPVRFIGSVLDITAQMTARQKIENTVKERTQELAEANRNLELTNKELKRSNEHLEEFAHAASHDLKEPIRKIRLYTHQLRTQLDNNLNEASVRSFNRIENAGLRMGDLVDDLLRYSHASVRPHEKELVDLNGLMSQVLDDLELIVEETHAVIEIDRLPHVNGYSRQLQQLLQNLVSNALKYHKTNTIPIAKISASLARDNGVEYHVISITDNGIGFEDKYADLIFQMFARLHAKNEYSGTGVGLAIVKKIVENHEGFIQVESIVDEGSTFHIFLPV